MTPSNESIDKAVYRVTEWIDPQERILVRGGDVRAEGWLQMEVDRYKEKWDEAWVQQNAAGKVALFTWFISQVAIDDTDKEKE